MADNFGSVERTIWQSFEDQLAIQKILYPIQLAIHKIRPNPFLICQTTKQTNGQICIMCPR